MFLTISEPTILCSLAKAKTCSTWRTYFTVIQNLADRWRYCPSGNGGVLFITMDRKEKLSPTVFVGQMESPCRAMESEWGAPTQIHNCVKIGNYWKTESCDKLNVAVTDGTVKLSLWQPAVSPLTSELDTWHLSVFSGNPPHKQFAKLSDILVETDYTEH